MKTLELADRVYQPSFKEELVSIIDSIIEDYTNNYKDDEEIDYIQLTVGTNGDLCEVSGSVLFGCQTGDNSYSGGAYGFRNWGLGSIDDETDSDELAEEIIEQLSESLAYEGLHDCYSC